MATAPTGSSDKPETPAAPEPTVNKVEALARHDSLLDIMKKKFATEERVEVKVRAESDVFVQVNGYSFIIKPNEKVRVPKSIQVLLEQGDYI